MKKVALMLIIILLLFSITAVQAADEKALNFSSNKREIDKGEEIQLTISSEELTGIEGTLSFDSEVWTLSSKNSENSFALNEETGKFALANISGEEKISATIILKSKEDTTVESSIIRVSEIEGSDESGESFNISNKEVTIKFKKQTNTQTPTNTIPNNTIPNNTIPQNKPVATTNNTSNSNVQSFPETGAENIFAVIVILGIISYIAYIKYKKYNF